MAITDTSIPVIQVTKTVLPDKKDFLEYLDRIWDTGWVTNQGPLAVQLEIKIQEYLEVSNVNFVCNGTTALQLAIKSLDLKGEIITTPYSYVATTSSILWQNCTAVFADIKPGGFTIDPAEIEKKITSKTSAILATHVYGIPCDVDKIKEIAAKHNLKVIYDAAHAFGVKINEQSVFNFGDVSATSFHATKIFHTIEGGAVITNNSDISKKVSLGKAFGHRKDEHFQLGINGKNSEFHAAIGLCNLKKIDEIIARRKLKFEFYKTHLSPLPVHTLGIPQDVTYNYGYFPVVFENHEQMMAVKNALEKEHIFPRRYFYPSLNKLPYLNAGECPVSENLSKKVLCLPFYQDLDDEIILKITGIIEKTILNG